MIPLAMTGAVAVALAGLGAGTLIAWLSAEEIRARHVLLRSVQYGITLAVLLLLTAAGMRPVALGPALLLLTTLIWVCCRKAVMKQERHAGALSPDRFLLRADTIIPYALALIVMTVQAFLGNPATFALAASAVFLSGLVLVARLRA